MSRMPSAPIPPDIALSMPFFRSSETVTSPKYRWLCYDRGVESFVILQWTLSGEGAFEGSQGLQRVRPGHAFLALLTQYLGDVQPKRIKFLCLKCCSFDLNSNFQNQNYLWGV